MFGPVAVQSFGQMLAYAFTIFSGAFLLFQVQPLIGKYILPWFGGGPGVWTTCLLFFQVVLLAGYAYAHMLTRWLKPRGQIITHLLVLAVALFFLPIIPADSWKPTGNEEPTLRILKLLTVTLGWPYFVLATTGPLLQHWFSRTRPGVSPYRLYALSNIGSLLALLSYPFFVEVHFSRIRQAHFWALGLGLYAVSCAVCAAQYWRASRSLSASIPGGSLKGHAASVSRLDYALWLLLPACAATLLMAITNKICQDIAAVPFLWVVPLSLYLLSFIICFDNPRWYVRLPFAVALVAALAGVCWAMFNASNLPVYQQLALYSAGLFICCMVCHGELYRRRPDPSGLTMFYLLIAAGGALGGLFVAVLAPLVFKDYYELHAGLWLCGLLFLVICLSETQAKAAPVETQKAEKGGWRPLLASFLQPGAEWPWLAAILPVFVFFGLDRFLAQFGQEPGQPVNRSFVVLRIATWGLLAVLVISWAARGQFKRFRYWRGLTCAWLSLGLVGLAVTLWMQGIKSGGGVVSMSRNFYGVLTVYEHGIGDSEAHHFVLRHGRITHGLQFVDAERAGWPTAYYNEESGVGLAFGALPQGGRRIGLIGLGAGTLTAYSRPGDYWRAYEINPEVKRLATERFHYLQTCAGKLDVALGDARLSLEREQPQQFDLLVLDAFSSDAIPVHLLTREAFELYQRHVKTNGVIAVHISNHYLDLEPVVANLAREFNYRLVLVDFDDDDDAWWLYPSTWALLTRDEKLFADPDIKELGRPPETGKSVPLWTDDFVSVFRILK